MNEHLSRAAILEADDLAKKEINIPEWGGKVFIRTMTGGERDAFEAEQQTNPHRDLRARLAVATVCDEGGNLLFTHEDVPVLTRKSGRPLDRVFAAAAKWNGITSADMEELRRSC